MARTRNGLTILEVVVVLILVVIILGVFLVPTFAPRNRVNVRPLKDATYVRQVQMAMMMWAKQNDGQYPLPGLVDRLPDPTTGLDAPGVGPQDDSLNHTAPLYSLLIMQNYFTPELVESPMEVSGRVAAKANYDYDAYDPSGDVYWDETFRADLLRLSHTSYAHVALCGEHVRTTWRDTGRSDKPMIGTRGPEDGATSGPKHDQSITLRFMEPHNAWNGNIVFADGHVDTLDSIEPASLQSPGMARAFNLFRMDSGALCHSTASSSDDVTRVWDPLE